MNEYTIMYREKWSDFVQYEGVEAYDEIQAIALFFEKLKHTRPQDVDIIRLEVN